MRGLPSSGRQSLNTEKNVYWGRGSPAPHVEYPKHGKGENWNKTYGVGPELKVSV